MFVDEIELVTADHTAQWQTPDNYNPARPFNAAVEITLAIHDNPASTTSAAAGSHGNSQRRGHRTCGR